MQRQASSLHGLFLAAGRRLPPPGNWARTIPRRLLLGLHNCQTAFASACGVELRSGPSSNSKPIDTQWVKPGIVIGASHDGARRPSRMWERLQVRPASPAGGFLPQLKCQARRHGLVSRPAMPASRLGALIETRDPRIQIVPPTALRAKRLFRKGARAVVGTGGRQTGREVRFWEPTLPPARIEYPDCSCVLVEQRFRPRYSLPPYPRPSAEMFAAKRETGAADGTTCRSP